MADNDDTSTQEEKAPELYNWQSLPVEADQTIILVANELKIVDALEAMKSGDEKLVAGWLEDGTLTKPTETQINKWERMEDKKFYCESIKPYLLIQQA